MESSLKNVFCQILQSNITFHIAFSRKSSFKGMLYQLLHGKTTFVIAFSRKSNFKGMPYQLFHAKNIIWHEEMEELESSSSAWR